MATYKFVPSSRYPSGNREQDLAIVRPEDSILITGAAGFIGSRVVENLLQRGFRNLRCFVRPSSNLSRLDAIIKTSATARIDVIEGNLLSRQDCETASRGVALIYHLAAGTGEKSFPEAFRNSVVATRNLLDASLQYGRLRRFVLVSSLAVYTNRRKSRWRPLDESCSIEQSSDGRGEAYVFAKVKQEQLLADYHQSFGVPHVVVRPGNVYGAGRNEIVGRVGLGSFGIFLHLGGSNPVPFTHVDNCAEAIALAGLVPGVEGEVFNIVDDDLPSSRRFLRMYKKNVRSFRSLFVPHAVSHGLCYLWEKYSQWSQGQLPPAFNRRRWHAYWKGTRYSNDKIKSKLGWKPKVPMGEGLRRYFESFPGDERHA
jgi:nucleoside-diphosphate-sugar epimerase